MVKIININEYQKNNFIYVIENDWHKYEKYLESINEEIPLTDLTLHKKVLSTLKSINLDENLEKIFSKNLQIIINDNEEYMLRLFKSMNYIVLTDIFKKDFLVLSAEEQFLITDIINKTEINWTQYKKFVSLLLNVNIKNELKRIIKDTDIFLEDLFLYIVSKTVNEISIDENKVFKILDNYEKKQKSRKLNDLNEVIDYFKDLYLKSIPHIKYQILFNKLCFLNKILLDSSDLEKVLAIVNDKFYSLADKFKVLNEYVNLFYDKYSKAIPVDFRKER